MGVRKRKEPGEYSENKNTKKARARIDKLSPEEREKQRVKNKWAVTKTRKKHLLVNSAGWDELTAGEKTAQLRELDDMIKRARDAELEDTESPNWETLLDEEVAYEQDTNPSGYAEFLKSCHESEVEDMEKVLASDPERLFLWHLCDAFATFQRDPGMEALSEEAWVKQYLQGRGFFASPNELLLCLKFLRLTPKSQPLCVGLRSEQVRSMKKNAKWALDGSAYISWLDAMREAIRGLWRKTNQAMNRPGSSAVMLAQKVLQSEGKFTILNILEHHELVIATLVVLGGKRPIVSVKDRREVSQYSAMNPRRVGDRWAEYTELTSRLSAVSRFFKKKLDNPFASFIRGKVLESLIPRRDGQVISADTARDVLRLIIDGPEGRSVPVVFMQMMETAQADVYYQVRPEAEVEY